MEILKKALAVFAAAADFEARVIASCIESSSTTHLLFIVHPVGYFKRAMVKLCHDSQSLLRSQSTVFQRKARTPA